MAEVFTKEIFDGKSFIDMAVVFTADGDVNRMNGEALDWMESVFKSRCYDQEGFDNTNEELDLCVFKKGYCELGLTEAHWKALVTPWQDFVTGVLHFPVKIVLDKFTTSAPPEWWTKDVGPVDLGAAELNALCAMDFVRKGE